MEKERRISIEAFEALLPDVCDRETSQDGARWSAKNPLWGHCAIVSVAAQELFGGELRRASFAGNPGFGENASYYWNALADGSEHDFTRAQFGAQYPRLRDPVPRTRAYVLFGPAGAGTALRENFKRTRQRYALLKWRIEKRLAGENPLFNDPMFEQCFLAACDSQCQKMRTRFQKLIFPEGIPYARTSGFGTAKLGLIYEINRQSDGDLSQVVDPAGLEPATSSMPWMRSTG